MQLRQLLRGRGRYGHRGTPFMRSQR
jgi:hypothetical protein